MGFTGDTAIDTKVGGTTVSVVEPEVVPNVAVMVVETCVPPYARPAALMVATPVGGELQVARAVMSWLEPSESEPVALNCWVAPAGMAGLIGVTVIELSEKTVSVAWPP